MEERKSYEQLKPEERVVIASLRLQGAGSADSAGDRPSGVDGQSRVASQRAV